MSTIKNYIGDIKGSSRNSKLFLISYLFYAIQGGAYWTCYTVFIQMAFGELALGTMLSLNTLLVALFAIPMGALSSKVGYKKMLIFCNVLGTLTFGITALVPNMFFLLIITILTGPPSAAWDILAAPVINATTTEKQRTTMNSMMYAGYWAIVALVSNLSGNGIVALQSSFGLTELAAYKTFLLITAVISLLGTIPVLFMTEIKIEKVTKAVNEKKKTFVQSFKEVANKEVLIYLVYMGLIGLGAGLFTPFFSNFFKSGLGLNPVQVGNVISAQYLAMVIGMLVCPLLVKKFGRISTLGISSLLSIPFMIIIANCNMFGSAMLPVLAVSFFMRSGLMNLAMPVMYTQILDFVEPDKRATLSGIQSTFRSGLTSISSFVAGIVMTIPAFTIGSVIVDGYTLPYYVASALYITATVILFKVYHKKYNRVEEITDSEDLTKVS